MALHHAEPGEVVNLKRWGADHGADKGIAICKTNEMEIIRMSMSAGKAIPTHHAKGALVLQCLEGNVHFEVHGKTKPLSAGELIYIEPNAPHALRAETDAVVLLTIVFTS